MRAKPGSQPMRYSQVEKAIRVQTAPYFKRMRLENAAIRVQIRVLQKTVRMMMKEMAKRGWF